MCIKTSLGIFVRPAKRWQAPPASPQASKISWSKMGDNRYNKNMLEIVKSFLKPEEAQQAGVMQGQYYERSGSCNRCGKCCSNIYLVYKQETINSVEMFENIQATNPEYASFKPLFQESDEHGLLFQCTHLQADNTCGSYKNRPDFCRTYPSEQSIIMGGKLAEGCGYQFRLLKNFQDVLKQVASQGLQRNFTLQSEL